MDTINTNNSFNKIILLLLLLVTFSSSKENKTNSNNKFFVSTDDHKVNIPTGKLIPKKQLDATDIFRSFSCFGLKASCPYVDPNKVIPQNRSCCKNLTRLFECSYVDRTQLLRYLNLLKSWNCTEQLEEECRLKTFSFNELAEKMYLSVCDTAGFNTTCNVLNINKKHFNDENLSEKNEIFTDPCQTVEEFYRFGSETSVVFYKLPICPVIWCAVHNKNPVDLKIPFWKCAPKRFFLN